MPITVNCDCGQSMRVKDEWAGRRARCPKCKRPLTVPDPSKPAAEEDEEVIEAVAAEEESNTRVIPKAKARREREEDRPRRRVRDDDEVIEAEVMEEERPSRVTTKPKSRAKLERDEEDDYDRPRRRRDEEDEDDRRDSRRSRPGEAPRPRRRKKVSESGGGWGIHISAGVVGGLTMMVLAAVWFVVGLYAGWIFFYPPILFILGLIAFVKGLMGGE